MKTKSKTKSSSVNVTFRKPTFEEVEQTIIKDLSKVKEGANNIAADIFPILKAIVRNVKSFTINDVVHFSCAKDFDYALVLPIAKTYFAKLAEWGFLKTIDGAYDDIVYIPVI